MQFWKRAVIVFVVTAILRRSCTPMRSLAGTALHIFEECFPLPSGTNGRKYFLPLWIDCELSRFIIVDLAIKCNPNAAIFIGHRLTAIFGQIDNAQAAMSQADWPIDMKAVVVRPTMGNNVRHLPQHFLFCNHRVRVVHVCIPQLLLDPENCGTASLEVGAENRANLRSDYALS